MPYTRESRESATTSPREGSSQRSTVPLATTEISVGCSGSPPHSQVAQHAIETGDFVGEVVVDGVIDLFPNLIHKEIEGGHHIDIDAVSVRYIFVIIIHRLIGEVIGTVVEDAFRGHEEIHGEVLSVEKEGTGPTRSPL